MSIELLSAAQVPGGRAARAVAAMGGCRRYLTRPGFDAAGRDMGVA